MKVILIIVFTSSRFSPLKSQLNHNQNTNNPQRMNVTSFFIDFHSMIFLSKIKKRRVPKYIIPTLIFIKDTDIGKKNKNKPNGISNNNLLYLYCMLSLITSLRQVQIL